MPLIKQHFSNSISIRFRFLRPKDPFGAICMFLTRVEDSALLKQSARATLHVCIQTLGDVRKFPTVIRKPCFTESAL